MAVTVDWLVVAGGGGGGMHLWGVRNNANPDETADACFDSGTNFFFPYWDHSGAGGGGGGGGVGAFC